MSKFALLWYWRPERLNDTWWKIESFSTDEHPVNTTVSTPERPATGTAFSWTSLDDHGRLTIGMTHDHLPDAPNLWWVLIDEPHPIAPTVSLVAFADATFPDGTVLTVPELRATGIKPGEQAGAIRWGKGDPKMEQIHVSPSYRRRRMSIKMIHAADIVNESAGWGGYLYGGAELTSDGQALAAAWSGSRRLHAQSVTVRQQG